jgi:hypothetical protein
MMVLKLNNFFKKIRLPKQVIADHVFQSDGALALVACADLQDRVLSYCKSHGYAPWGAFYQASQITEDSMRLWRQGLLDALSELLTATVWVRHIDPNDEKSKQRLYLSQTEGFLSGLWQYRPSHHHSTMAVIDKWPGGGDNSWLKVPPQSMHLDDFLVSNDAFDLLLSRCSKNAIAPYCAADLAAVQKLAHATNGEVTTLWTTMNDDHAYVGLMALTHHHRHHATDVDAADVDLTSQPVAIWLPRAWGSRPDDDLGFGSFGKKLEIDPHGYFVVQESTGRERFAQLQNFGEPPLESKGDIKGDFKGEIASLDAMAQARVVMSTSYAGIWTIYSRTGFYEVNASDLVQDSFGDWLCDIVTLGGVMVNPCGTKALAGSLNFDGCMLKRTDVTHRQLAWLPLGKPGHTTATEEQKIGPHPQQWWADARGMSEKRRAVQDTESGLWGFLNEDEDVIITPQFAQVGQFYANICWASLPDDKQRRGLINPFGEWLTPRLWSYITWQNAKNVIVQTFDDSWGVISVSSHAPNNDTFNHTSNYTLATLPWKVPLRSAQAWLDLFDVDQSDRNKRPSLNFYVGNQSEKTREEKIIHAIDLIAENNLLSCVQHAKTQASLAGLVGKFEVSPTQTMLMQVGLWGMSVKVLRDQPGLLSICAGETGTILTQYPVSLNTFDINQEAPVADLNSAPHAIKGVPWGDLCFYACEG